jgi:hypothetical protein
VGAAEAAGCVVSPAELCDKYLGSLLSCVELESVAGAVGRLLSAADKETLLLSAKRESAPRTIGEVARVLLLVALCLKVSKKFRILFINLESSSWGTLLVTVTPS